MTRLLLGAVLIGASAASAHAQARPDSARDVIRVGSISVHAARPVTTAGGASALEVRLDSLAIGPAASMEQVLRELPLVQVRTNSRGEAQFSLRGSGSDSRQVAVLVDGVPLSLGWDDRADLSVLPATAATALTLVRGLPSVLYGPNVLGGVVDIDVAQQSQPGPGTHRELQAAVDHTGGWALAAQMGTRLDWRGGLLSVRGGAGLRDRPGLALPGDIEQPAPAGGVRFRAYDPDLRTNTDVRSVDGFIAARFAAAGGAWAALSSSAFRAERGIAAELHAARPRHWRYPSVGRWITALTAGTGQRGSPFGGVGDMEAVIGVDVGHVEIESFSDATYTQVVDTERGADRTLSVRLLADQSVAERGELRGALTYADIWHEERLSDASPAEYRQRIWSAAGEAAWRLGMASPRWGSLRLSLGGAVDGADTPLSGDKRPLPALTAWGARAGATAATATGRLLLHAGASRRARFPSLRELYSGALGRFEPNPALRPETLTAAEAGATTRIGSDSELQLVGFYRSLAGAIEQVTLATGRRQRVNLGEARSAGVELMGTTRVGRLGVAADVTMQRVALYSDGARQDVQPEYQPEVAGGLHLHAPLALQIAAGADLRFVGQQYCNDPNTPGAQLALSASHRVDVDLAREFRLRAGAAFGSVEVRAAVDNIADAAIYDQCGLSQPGRTLRLQVRMR